MGLNFTTIDFETASFARGSVCAVGLTTVRDGLIRDTTAWHVDPPTGPFFTNTWVHGISAETVAGAPSWSDSLARISSSLDGYPLLAYSGFDKGVYTAANAAAGISGELEFIDILAIVRLRIPGLDSYKLTAVNDHLGGPEFRHHDPGADSQAAARIAGFLAEEAGTSSIDALWQQVLDHRATARLVRTQWFGQNTLKSELPIANPNADPTHPLYGHTVCFSGGLAGMSRDDARGVAASHGASIDLSVTRKTTMLVVGDFDPATLRPGANLSSKVQKALALAEKGQSIEIMTGPDFLDLIEEGLP